MTATSTLAVIDEDSSAVVSLMEAVETANAAVVLADGSGPVRASRARSNSSPGTKPPRARSLPLSPSPFPRSLASEVSGRRRRPRPASLAPRQRVGAWRVEGDLGRGGMASVYAVTHAGFGKRAALKLCHRTVLGPDFTPEVFLREARVANLVDHAGMPDVFATGTYDGRPYLVMERLAGETLGQLVDRGALDRVAGIEVLLEVLDVLAAAHAAGVVHRDLKLDNVFVMREPGAGGRRVKLLDWGVAYILGEADPMRGMIAGTLTYVAPEQIRADGLTPAADLYALGVLAYHVLLGAPPFAADVDLELIRKHLHELPPSPRAAWPEIPTELARVLVGLLAKQPGERPPIDVVRHALRAARTALLPKRTLRHWLTAAPPPADPFRRGVPAGKPRGKLVGAAVAVALTLASLASLVSV